MSEDTAKIIAEQLLQIKAIKLQPEKPFTWASGWKSPIYCDNRISLSYPKVRTYIRQALVKEIERKYGKPELIAGVATAAIAQGALVAEAMGLPFVYVRSSPKDHGRENLIEGEIREEQSVVVIEDLISTGQSSLKAVQALRDAGCNVKGMISIFTYGFEHARKNFEEAGCPVVSLCDYSVLINQALESGYIKKEEIETLEDWRSAPSEWEQVNDQKATGK
jgi:orotate phosphoribosyltransferase